MPANLCVDAHLRGLLEAGFDVAVVMDETAAAQAPGLDGYQAALTNFRFLACSVLTTQEVKNRLAKEGRRFGIWSGPAKTSARA